MRMTHGRVDRGVGKQFLVSSGPYAGLEVARDDFGNSPARPVSRPSEDWARLGTESAV